MIRGVVTAMRPIVDVILRLPGQPDFAIECVIDTGFAGALTLPPDAVTALNLPLLYDVDTNLANNTAFRAPLHLATVVWDKQELRVTVLALGHRPLLGMALLTNHRLYADFVEGGPILLKRHFHRP